MSVKRSNKQLYKMIRFMIFIGTLVIANVLFTMISHKHIWSQKDVLNAQIASSIVDTNIEAKRGTIYDRNHNVIAQEVSAYTIVAYLDHSVVDEKGRPDYVKDPEYTAEKLKEVLPKINEENVTNIIKNAIKNERSQTELGTGTKRLDKETKEKIEEMKLPGIAFVDATTRNYPTTPFASNLVGFATYDEDEQKIMGKMGLEQTMDKYLSGRDGRVQYQQTVSGDVLPGTTKVYKEAENGKDVVLTLDSNLQSVVEAALVQTMEENNGTTAWCVVMEVETGRVLAWASNPTFDQNKHEEIPSYVDQVSGALYEPGSVMKPFTYAAAIDTGQYPANQTFVAGEFWYNYDPNANKITRIPKKSETPYPRIADAMGKDYGTITFEKGFAVSSNVGICELLANYMNYGTWEEYLDKFGFFKEVDTPFIEEGAVDGKIGRKNLSFPTDYLSTGFGQSSSITMLQLLQAYTAILNDGTMIKPYVVEAIEDSETGKVVEEFGTETVGTPISKETANHVKDLMRQVVTEDGASGQRFAIDGVDMVAKTGTGEIWNTEIGGYDKYNYSSSIIAAAPYNDPKIMVYWGMNSTNYYAYSPEPFKQIMRTALIANGISGGETSSNTEETYEKWETYSMPGVVNHSLDYAKSKMDGKKVHLEIIGDGSNIVDQYPKKEAIINSNDRVFLLTDGQTIQMPNMTGWTRKDITAFWQLTGISVKTSGYGKVKAQNIEPGQTIQTDIEILVELE